MFNFGVDLFFVIFTYRDAEVVKDKALLKFIRVVVFVRRKKFAAKSVVGFRGVPQVE